MLPLAPAAKVGGSQSKLIEFSWRVARVHATDRAKVRLLRRCCVETEGTSWTFFQDSGTSSCDGRIDILRRIEQLFGVFHCRYYSNQHRYCWLLTKDIVWACYLFSYVCLICRACDYCLVLFDTCFAFGSHATKDKTFKIYTIVQSGTS